MNRRDFLRTAAGGIAGAIALALGAKPEPKLTPIELEVAHDEWLATGAVPQWANTAETLGYFHEYADLPHNAGLMTLDNFGISLTMLHHERRPDGSIAFEIGVTDA